MTCLFCVIPKNKPTEALRVEMASERDERLEWCMEHDTGLVTVAMLYSWCVLERLGITVALLHSRRSEDSDWKLLNDYIKLVYT